MTVASDASLDTRQSMLDRLHDLGDGPGWQSFFDRYWRVLYQVARHAGLADPDAQDVVQETVMAVAGQMPRFRYDPARGSFKGWLFRILRRRIADHLRRLYRQPSEDGSVEEFVAPGGDELEAAWEREWERSVLQAAIAEVRARVAPKQFQIFDYCVLQEWPVAKVAATLGISATQVYLARHRVSHAVKRAARRINDGPPTG